MLRPALLTGKLLRLLRGKKSGRAVGAAALVLCPNLYSRLSVEGKILVITGSDGKSSVCALVTHMLRAAGHRVVTNCEADGRSVGTAAALVSAATLKGKIPCDYLVLEADGRTSDALLSLGKPDFLLVTDLFAHHGPTSSRRAALLSLIDRAVDGHTRLILNAMEPAAADLRPELGRTFFGASPAEGLSAEGHNLVSAGSLCPRCGRALSYRFVFHHHIGDYHCAHCGAVTPRADYLLTSFSASAPECAVNGIPFPAELAAPYHYLNITAATALICETLGITPGEAAGLCAGYRLPAAFYTECALKGRRAVSLLCRTGNPISLDRGLEYAAGRAETKTVLLWVDRPRHPAEEDVSWLYDTTFELLRGRAECVVCAGDCRLDVAARLVYAGLPRESILLCGQEGELAPLLSTTRGTLYILADRERAGRILRALQKGDRA
ncbi:MAG: DUF1727 domain-containing protein [Clostridia bacterium]|nr:DUF1727 domain-containing protein [Clostridia bacterium]